MKLLPYLFLAIVIITVMVAGCTSPQPVPQPVVTTTPATPIATTPVTPAVPVQLIRDWIVTTFGVQDGTAVTYPTTQISLTFNPDGTLYGNGGCNNYNGPFTLTGQTLAKGSGITVGPLVTTQKVCPVYSAQENTYLQILRNAVAYVVDGNQLTITDRTGNVLIYKT
ncbi:MAG: META domain-containing protein [Methanomicrobiales archaeon]|nr:META domain-containing protein [Methanomicrobiales archaeon]